MAKIDFKDLKNFKEGDNKVTPFKRIPVDRSLKVSDLPNLQPHEVNVIVELGKNDSSTGERVVKTKLCRLDKVPDNKQFDFLYEELGKKEKEHEHIETALGVEKKLHDLIDTFLVEVAWEFKEVEGYSQRLTWWKKELGDILVEEVTTSKIKSGKSVLKKKGYTGATVNRYVSCLQGAFRFGIENDWLSECPISNKKVPKEEEKKRVRWLDDMELKKLFAAVDNSESKNLKDMVHFSLNTGCRKSEALGLRWKDIDFKNNRIYFRVVKRKNICTNASINDSGEVEFQTQTQVFEEGLKNGDDVKVLKLDKMPVVRDILVKRRGNANIDQSDKVFPNNIRRSWDSLLKRIGLEDFRWHDLRHCCASYLAQDGKSLGLIGKHLGHKSSVSTERYAHLSDEETIETGDSVSRRLYG